MITILKVYFFGPLSMGFDDYRPALQEAIIFVILVFTISSHAKKAVMKIPSRGTARRAPIPIVRGV
jgi:hypothetical protein